MDINDIIKWIEYVALLKLLGLIDDADSGPQAVYVGDPIKGGYYGG